MDFDLRQWLLILGPIFIVGVLLHGYFRMRAGQNEIKMKLDRSFLSRPGDQLDVDDLNLLKAELPNGGARVIPKNMADDDVPVLRESVKLPSISAKSGGAKQSASVPASQGNTPKTAAPSTREPVVAERPAKAPRARKSAEAAAGKPAEPATRKQQTVTEEQPPTTPKPEKFVVIYVLALGKPFPGQALLEILLESGMTFGDMNIFHRLDDSDKQLFSLASAVEPGTFDMVTMDQFSTPGISLFMRVHELAQPIEVMEEMLSVANLIAEELHGEVRDDTRSVMTPQTVEHCRQSIQEFQFKHSA